MTELRQEILELLHDSVLSADEAAQLLKNIRLLEDDADATKRIFRMLRQGQVTADEALELFEALRDAPPLPPSPPQPQVARRGIARSLRIVVQSLTGKNKTIDVQIPLSLAKFGMKVLPKQAREQLAQQGIDLDDLLTLFETDTALGPLVDTKVHDEHGEARAHIVIEVI